MRADLHTHSTASDGTHSPAELMAVAAAAGLDVVGLTDHDSAAGWTAASAAARQVGITLVPGMEVSTIHHGAGVHVLGYLPDPTYPPLADELARILRGRSDRLGSIVSRLRSAGIDITEQEVMEQAGPAPAIGRPHVADVLVRKGIVATRGEAFERWLSGGRPGHVVRYATRTAEMVALLTQAGGAAVIAHPWGRGSRRVVDRTALREFQAAGLVGIEVDHQDHSLDERAALRAMAGELDLVVTGSSDFHGGGKVDHDLGCNLTAAAELDRLLEAAARHAAASSRPVPQVVRP